MQVRILSLRMDDKEKLEEIQAIAIDYAGTDGGHHKQYALAKIVRIIQGDNYETWISQNFEHRDDWDEGTP